MVSLLCSLLIFGCKSEDEELSICADSCTDEITTDRLEEVYAKVIINNTATNDDGEILKFFALSINPDDLDKDTWSIVSEFILVPCNLPERYEKENLHVIISGNRKSCCNVLTQPYFRGAYGCKFEITDIRIK